MTPTLGRISVTPVKGTALHHPDAADLGVDGIAGNRRFHLIDDEGRLVSGDTIGELVQVRTAFEPDTGTLRCTFPDGSVAEGPTEDGVLGQPTVTDFFGRDAPGQVVEGPFADAFSHFTRTPLRLVRLDHDREGPDVFTLSLVSFASVADLGRRGGRVGDLDARRFRMNLELDGCEPYEEDTWDGRTIRVGEAALALHGQIPRCRFTTLDPATGRKDFDTLKEIAAYRPLIDAPRGIPFGMYAEVEVTGRVRVGDAVTIA
jgi:uncharacterized protein YcbX